jgi:glutathione synthase/RimK-type ligase-like ATP-grasp enzyme
MLRIAYSGKSKPGALKISEQSDDVELIRRTAPETDINWGRNKANSQLNPDISNVTNKRRMRELFKEHGVPTPHLYGDDEFLHFPVVGRPDTHTKGRGFWKCNNLRDYEKAIRGTRKKKAATHFMEYVEADREYRVHVFKGKSIRISQKVFTDESKKEYTTGKPGDIRLRNVREAAKQALEAVGLDFGAVDILARGENNSDVWVLEVNAAPGLGGSMPRLYAETFRKWKDGEWNS